MKLIYLYTNEVPVLKTKYVLHQIGSTIRTRNSDSGILNVPKMNDHRISNKTAIKRVKFTTNCRRGTIFYGCYLSHKSFVGFLEYFILFYLAFS